MVQCRRLSRVLRPTDEGLRLLSGLRTLHGQTTTMVHTFSNERNELNQMAVRAGETLILHPDADASKPWLLVRAASGGRFGFVPTAYTRQDTNTKAIERRAPPTAALSDGLSHTMITVASLKF